MLEDRQALAIQMHCINVSCYGLTVMMGLFWTNSECDHHREPCMNVKQCRAAWQHERLMDDGQSRHQLATYKIVHTPGHSSLLLEKHPLDLHDSKHVSWWSSRPCRHGPRQSDVQHECMYTRQYSSSTLRLLDAFHLGHDKSLYCIQVMADYWYMEFALVASGRGCLDSRLRSRTRSLSTI